MKQNIKIFLIALILGMASSYFFCYKFDNTIITNAIESKITYFYVGSYNNLESANVKKNNHPNSIIYNDNGIYKVIIGVYTKKESIDLMESYFLDSGINFRIDTLKISNEFINLCSNYEILITNSDKSYYDNINNSLLKLFNEYKATMENNE